jgi:3-oxoacyl-[acyl-carrier-protein] synthase II
MGAITPLGHDVESLYRHQIEGRSGVDWIRNFDARTFPTKFASEVKDFDLSRYIPRADRFASCGPNTHFALVAAKQAIEDSGLDKPSGVDRARIGVYLGNGEGSSAFEGLVTGIAASVTSDRPVVSTSHFLAEMTRRLSPSYEHELELHSTAAHVAAEFELLGPNLSCLTACAASSQAIGEATELIRHGDADLMLSGGAHSMIHPLGITGFNLLTALSTHNEDPKKASRPFDATRDGFVIGEGAGMVVLEELEHAKRRKAPIFAEIVGYGTTADAFRVTDSHPEGRGAIACVRHALSSSGLAPTDIDYINAHGTSTQVNDRVETVAIKKIFGDYAYKLPVSSSKSMLGHLIAAAGVVELITCVMTIRHGVLPPTINYEHRDPECDLDYVPNTAREKKVRNVQSNSFGFGGQNISLIVSRF